MRYLLILLFHISLFASSYSFDEYKFVFGANQEFHKSGTISFDANKTTITYDEPQFKQIITDGKNVSIKGSSGKIYKLKGKARVYTNQFINTMTQIDDFKELKTNKNFDVVKEKQRYILTFKGAISDQIPKAHVEVKNSIVISFKLFMKNNDTLEIVKRKKNENI